MLTKAAVRIGEKMYTGRRHSDAIYAAIMAEEEAPITQNMQGFVTDTGKFLSRVEAREEAVLCGQVADEKRGKPLTSEEVW